MNEEQVVEFVARNLFPLAEWDAPTIAWVQCPGQEMHTGSNGKRDCRLTINDGKVPTLFCCHQSCSGEVASWNHRLRSAIGKMKKSAGNVLRSVGITAKTSIMLKPAPSSTPEPQAFVKLDPVPIPAPIADGQFKHFEACFRSGELVSIVLGFGDEGKINGRGSTMLPSEFAADHDSGTYVRVNPMLPNGAGDADVAAWRHVLIESDKAPLELQWAAILASGFPVSVAVASGGRSIHAWVRVDAATPEEYRVRANQAADAMERFEGMTVDRKALNCGRLARLAGCRRGENWQTLLAVNIGAACWDDWSARVIQEDVIKETLPELEQEREKVSFFYRKAKKDFILVRGASIIPLSESGVKLSLRQEGAGLDKDGTDAEVYRIMTEAAIDYDGSMPGYPIGLHVEGGRRYFCDATAEWLEGVAPTELTVGAGWPTVYTLTNQLFSPRVNGEVDEQSAAWWHWIYALKASRDALRLALAPLDSGARRQVRPGQAMVLCGPKNCGKSFLVNQVVRPLLGGRQQDAHKAFSSGSDGFNGELLQGEVWTVDDKEHSHRIDQRRQFAASIKSMMYSGRVGFHAKHKEQVTIQPWARLFILCNDQDEAIRVLPPLTPDIEDKIHLFRCYFSPTPMPTSTGAEWAAYEEKIHSELCNFAGWLDVKEVPIKFQDQRNGSKCWHDAHIVALLSNQSPEHQLAQLLVEGLESRALLSHTPLVAMAILNAIQEHEGIRSTARNLIHDDPAILGRYLNRIAIDGARYRSLMGLDVTVDGKHRGANMYNMRLDTQNV